MPFGCVSMCVCVCVCVYTYLHALLLLTGFSCGVHGIAMCPSVTYWVYTCQCYFLHDSQALSVWIMVESAVLAKQYNKKNCVVVHLPSHVHLYAVPWTAECQASLFLTISWSSPKLMSIALVMPSSHLILWCPILLQSFPSSGAFPICHSNKYLRLISLKIDWFDLLPVQGTFRILLQHHSLKASVLWRFFTVQLS